MQNIPQFGSVNRIIFILGSIACAFVTAWLFFFLNQVQPTPYIDEIFHVPQTIKYCRGKYFEWNPKITTLPALYFITSQILKTLKLCNITYMRCINLVTVFINLILITYITKYLHKINDKTSTTKRWTHIAMSYNMAYFPPLFFYFFLYYTDVFSVCMVLFMLLLHIRGNLSLAAIPGIISILVRQTNIIWMFLLAAEYCLYKMNIFSKYMLKSRDTKNLWDLIRQEPMPFFTFTLSLIQDIWMYSLSGISFVIFVLWNEGIVVGDRSSHQPTIHLPQIFYFSVFTLLFAWPYMIKYLKDFFVDIYKHWVISSIIFGLIVATIHNNTLVHPFVLADNRHYVFYFWSKFMNRYEYFKYSLAPLYAFAMYSFYKCIDYVQLPKLILYFCCLFIVLIPQLLLEPRYFIIPYIFFRLNLRFPERWQIILESLTILIINVGQFYLFVNKTFYWKDLKEPQRIGW